MIFLQLLKNIKIHYMANETFANEKKGIKNIQEPKMYWKIQFDPIFLPISGFRYQKNKINN